MTQLIASHYNNGRLQARYQGNITDTVAWVNAQCAKAHHAGPVTRLAGEYRQVLFDESGDHLGVVYWRTLL